MLSKERPTDLSGPDMANLITCITPRFIPVHKGTILVWVLLLHLQSISIALLQYYYGTMPKTKTCRTIEA